MAEIRGLEILNIIEGRVNPYIYAFQTNRVPNSLKVGDTVRGVNTRLKEWALYYPNLQKIYDHIASIPEKKLYFRDYSVHQYLEDEKHRSRLQREDFKQNVYYSQEFFRDATYDDLEQAVQEIISDAYNPIHKYTFYDYSGLPKDNVIQRSETPYIVRKIQEEVIDNFKNAIEKGRDNLLMYAVMRFGKTFTALCCAQSIKAKCVMVVSAKGDVLDEWRVNVLTPKQFENFVFLTQKELSNDHHIINKTIENGKTPIIFLTLQDLQGKDIKEKHSEVFQHKFDLLIIDETHFGARADEYGRVLKKSNNKNDDKTPNILSEEDEKTLKELNSYIRLHLSGTPYNIIMGNEFTRDDIIAFCKYSDILIAKEKWYEEHPDKDEWENPYYGFPQMIRFAFSPSEKAKQLLKNLQKDKIKYSLSELFVTKSTKKQQNNSDHRQFIHRDEVLELLQAIDGAKEDSNVLAFLDNERIKNGEMCHHIVCALPNKSSCDAMAELLVKEKDKFNNLCNYEVINITGHDSPFRKIAKIKSHIADCENRGKKTISLTVDKMLTGTTVPQWDTMIFLKSTKSAQEYDQASFRIQSQFIKEYKDKDGKVIKRDMKPQTLFVDFDPDRMFRVQERKAFGSMLFEGERGLDSILDKIKEDLKFSPIISLNANHLHEIKPTDVIESVMEYSRQRSAHEEARDLPVDLELLQNDKFRKYISSQKEIDSKNGWTLSPNDDKDTNDFEEDKDSQSDKKSNDNKSKTNKEEKEKDINKQFATLYVNILFFAYLSNDEISSLESIINNAHSNENNSRIFRHLDLDIDVLKYMSEKMDAYKLRSLDNSIRLLNQQIKDSRIPLSERINNASRKFGRMSDSEIVTPDWVANEMVSLLPESIFDGNHKPKFLDIASKQAEFARALILRFGDKVKECIYSIPTSPAAYEFTRKIYGLLDIPIENIFSDFNSYDLIGENGNELLERLKTMNFDITIGNPPYHVNDGGAGVSAKPIYNNFVNVSIQLSPPYISMIMPAKWYTDGKGLDDFRASMLADKHIATLHDFTDSREVFPTADVAGGICFFMWDKSYDGDCLFVSHHNSEIKTTRRTLNENSEFIRHIDGISIINKVKSLSSEYYDSKVSTRKPFGLATNVKPTNDGDLTLRHNKGIGKFQSNLIEKGKEIIPLWKIIISYLAAEHAGQSDKEGRKKILSSLNIMEPYEICTETYLVVDAFSSEQEVKAALKYFKSRIVRFLISQLAATQHITKEKFSFVPLQDFTENSDIDWSQSVADIDRQLYKKYNLTDEEIAFIESMIKPM